MVERVNQRMQGWAQYFRYGHPRRAYRDLNAFVVARVQRHLARRSQRPCRLPAGMTWYGFITGPLGVQLL